MKHSPRPFECSVDTHSVWMLLKESKVPFASDWMLLSYNDLQQTHIPCSDTQYYIKRIKQETKMVKNWRRKETDKDRKRRKKKERKKEGRKGEKEKRAKEEREITTLHNLSTMCSLRELYAKIKSCALWGWNTGYKVYIKSGQGNESLGLEHAHVFPCRMIPLYMKRYLQTPQLAGSYFLNNT
jgi:hypothetical protein